MRELRIAAGKNQTEFAEIGHVSLRSQQQYEKGYVPLNSDYLAHLHNAGYDVHFLLTGKKSKATLGKPESELLCAWNNANPQRKALAWLALTAPLKDFTAEEDSRQLERETNENTPERHHAS